MEPTLFAPIDEPMLSNDFAVEEVESYHLVGASVVRSVMTRAGQRVQSSVPDTSNQDEASCKDLGEAFDAAWLRSRAPLPLQSARGTIRVADLFCGAGGMSVGLHEAARALGLRIEHTLAADIESEALSTYVQNFSPRLAEERPIEDLVDSPLRAALSPSERRLRRALGDLDLVVGGPPCQGHSDLNNHTRRHDPKNELYDRMARFAEVVSPRHVVIENVPGVRHDKGRVFERTLSTLVKLGYRVDAYKIQAEQLGVPQRRHRAVIVASTSAPIGEGFLRKMVRRFSRPLRSVRWAIGDLCDIRADHPFDQVTAVSRVSQKRIDWLFENNEHDLPDEMRPDCHRTKTHTYKSVYGRLYWEQPAWTITTGFQVMGQGRFLHPTRRRVITSHEAARLQFFPDFFDFGITNRKGYAKMIGNAVPPKVAYVLGVELLR